MKGNMTDKYFMATVHYSEPHTDKYLINNVKDEKEAFYIAENQNADPKYSQLWKEDSGEIEDQTITIKEVVWDSERKDFVDK
jgi:hypothetical protein